MLVRYLSAGRSAPFEHYRGAIDGPDRAPSATAIGHLAYVARRHDIDSLTGDYLALHERADLRIKVEARLQVLLPKRLRLEWSQSRLTIGFTGKGKGNEYSASSEASGVVHLAGVLAALYDDEVSALLLDEPEISLHPQWQRFLLEEMKGVSGDPVAEPTKKLIVVSTHSSAMLSLQRLVRRFQLRLLHCARCASDTASAHYWRTRKQDPQALFARIGEESHRQALFARTVLLVEGPNFVMKLSLRRSLPA